MSAGTQLPKYSIGLGDRFAHEAAAQLQACLLAAEAGVTIAPVWNKSNREHTIIGSNPAQTRAAVEVAVAAARWTTPYFVDADHINLQTVDRFLDPCNFFTIDVADRIGEAAAPEAVSGFVARHRGLLGTKTLPGASAPFVISQEFLEQTAAKYLSAVLHAGEIFRAIATRKDPGSFVTELSMDETDAPQSPAELLVILAAIAEEKIPIQTIAPKFSGRFNKGVDYVGDVAQFAKEFRDDLATIAYAVEHFGLPANLKLSVHSGSDKFSIYSAIHEAIKDFDAGVHVKTAGTTWLEELIGLGESGGEGLLLAKQIYAKAYGKAEELCAPYATVIDIHQAKLPAPEVVNSWSSEEFVGALRHDPKSPAYNPDLRQLLHVGFKVAAGLGTQYTDALRANAEIVSRNVTFNLFERHIRPIFLGR